MRLENITIITTHFYDFSWTKTLIDRLIQNTDFSRIKEVIIINQDRSVESREKLQDIASFATIVGYPKNEEYFKKRGHDHAAVLNLAVQQATGDFICIFDSDCHPFSSSWLPDCEDLMNHYDAVVALDKNRSEKFGEQLSHPCFMMLKKRHLSIPLAFDEGFNEPKNDTGRLIGRQIERTGDKVLYIKPTIGFDGSHGEIYLDKIYHHRKGTYKGADGRLTSQIGFRDEFFRNIVIKHGRYQMNMFDELRYKIRKISNSGWKRSIPAYIGKSKSNKHSF